MGQKWKGTEVTPELNLQRERNDAGSQTSRVETPDCQLF